MKNNPKTLEPARKPFIQNTVKSNLLVSLLTMDKNQTCTMMKMEQKLILKVTPHSHNTIFMFMKMVYHG